MKPISLFFVVLTICLACAAAFLGRTALSSYRRLSKPEVTTAVDVQQSQGGPVRMIRFVLSDQGIYPRHMWVDQGLLNIALEDKTAGSNGLLIESIQGDQRTQITQISRAEKQWRGRALVRLVPGRYVVSDASQPEHIAELIVNP